jgi:mannose-6-phosphate isomerase-like protein (cupin superfamily)
MSTLYRSRVIRLVEAQARIPGSAGEHAVVVFQPGPLDIALSLPQRPSQQSPHAEDEVYFVVRGRGVLLHDGKREPFDSGDLLFVAAGIEHQIEDHLQGFAMLRVFYGPPGGDVPA